MNETPTESQILLSEGYAICPETPEKINEAIQRFRDSDLSEYTYQVRRGNPEDPMGFDFSVEDIRALINNPACDNLRILFSIDDGEVKGNGYLSVVLVGLDGSRLLIAPELVIKCCGRPPGGG